MEITELSFDLNVHVCIDLGDREQITRQTISLIYERIEPAVQAAVESGTEAAMADEEFIDQVGGRGTIHFHVTPAGRGT